MEVFDKSREWRSAVLSFKQEKTRSELGVKGEQARHGFVVLAYRDSPYLNDCIQSLVQQDMTSDIIIATSTPSAHIEQIARYWGVDVEINLHRSGIGEDWNFALEHARWPLVTLAHQDDVYKPAFTRKTLEAFERQPQAGIVFTSHDEVHDDGKPRVRLVWQTKMLLENLFLGRRERASGLRRRLLLSFGSPIGCSTVTYNLQANPGFRFDTKLSMCLDWDAWWRLHLADFPFAHVPDRLVSRRYNVLSETWSGLRDGRRELEDRLMFSRIWPQPFAQFWTKLYKAGYR
jgi:GT2 family glycosyltransferase